MIISNPVSTHGLVVICPAHILFSPPWDLRPQIKEASPVNCEERVRLSLLCSSCRVRPLSESVNDLFREVSLLRRRITELSHRLATLEPFLRHHGYRGEGEEEQREEEEEEAEAGGGRAPTPQGPRGEAAGPAGHTRRTVARGSRVVRRRRVRVLKNGGVRLVQRERWVGLMEGRKEWEWGSLILIYDVISCKKSLLNCIDFIFVK